MEKTAQETYEAIREGAEKAKGAPFINVNPNALLVSFEYLIGKDGEKQPNKIES